MIVERTSFRTWRVYKTSNEFYFVSFDDKGWHCSCPQYLIEGKICNHIKLVKKEINFKGELKE